jgi:hypothetical protein
MHMLQERLAQFNAHSQRAFCVLCKWAGGLFAFMALQDAG